MATYEHVLRVRVPRDEAFEWWTDYRETDHTGPLWEGFGEGTRTVVEKGDDHAVLHDTFDGHAIDTHVTFHPPDRVELEGEALGTRFSAEIVFEEARAADEEGGPLTVIRARGSVDPEHLLAKLSAPLWMGRVVRTIKEDLDIHGREMEQELGPDGPEA